MLTNILKTEHDHKSAEHRQIRQQAGPVFREHLEEDDVEESAGGESLQNDVGDLKGVAVGTGCEQRADCDSW